MLAMKFAYTLAPESQKVFLTHVEASENVIEIRLMFQANLNLRFN